MSKILVTGSAGFIGFHVARRLLDLGHDVAGIDNLTPYYDVALKHRRHAMLESSGRFRAHIVDLADRDATDRVFGAERPDIVIHLAAQAGVRYAIEHPDAYVQTNVVGTFHLLELARAFPVAHFLLASTSSVYGANTTMPFTELDRTETPLTIYSATKKSTELMAHSYAHLWSIPTTVFRFFTVYGPWGRPDMALFKFVDAMLEGRPIEVYNHGRMERDFTYIDDLVEAILRLMACPPQQGQPVGAFDSLSPVAPHRVVNIGNAQPVGLLAFIEAIEQNLGRPAEKIFMDLQPGDVPRTFADTSLLHALTGFRPGTSVADGVAAFVAWFRDYYQR